MAKKLINKYDYIRWLIDQPEFLFFTNNEIISGFNTEFKKYKFLNQIDEELNDDEDEENKEFDSLEFYKMQLEENKDIDKDDPKIIEGIRIDELSRKYIESLYPDHEVIDLDDLGRMSNEDKFEKTKAIFFQNKNVVIFQSIFMNNTCITKPDAIVKTDKTIQLIETKGTTTAKRKLFLDVFFQYKLLRTLDFLNEYEIELSLCLIDYCRAQRGEAPLAITPNFWFKKSPPTMTGLKNEEHKKLIKQGYGVKVKNEFEYTFESYPMNLRKICDGDFSDIQTHHEESEKTKLSKSEYEFIELIQRTLTTFEDDIKELTELLPLRKDSFLESLSSIKPSIKDNNKWCRSSFWPQLKELYYLKGYLAFQYSGTVVNHTKTIEQLCEDEENSLLPDKTTTVFISKHGEFYKDCIGDRLGITPVIETLDNKSICGRIVLKNKKVYFDFETISSPFRPINNCLPFAQIITQCSIIKDHNDGVKIADLECSNLLFDPLNITIQNFKDLVDDLYCGEDYSYVVYNVSFERSRLNELIDYINEEEYTNKIKIIVSNLYDLANWFDPRKKDCLKIKKLKGFYSIKKVLPLISEESPKIFEMTKCVDYKTLPVGNGLVCQNKTLERFFGSLNDQQWNELSHDLKIYCENDVRAMIAVEYYGKQFR
ncbi:MAG: DUF2779 domain-containing protein [Mycoplasma sp.]